jgi:hypothetical protein
MLSMVGARNASINAMRLCEKLASELGTHGYVIVSGLARGIDTAAHIGALDTVQLPSSPVASIWSIHRRTSIFLMRSLSVACYWLRCHQALSQGQNIFQSETAL